MFLYRTIKFHTLQKPFILLFEILEIEPKASGMLFKGCTVQFIFSLTITY